MTDALIVFVNGATVKLPSGATVLDAVAAHDAAAAAEVRAGTRAVADSRRIRGLSIQDTDRVAIRTAAEELTRFVLRMIPSHEQGMSNGNPTSATDQGS